MRYLTFAFDMLKISAKAAVMLLQTVLRTVMALIATLCRLLGIKPPSMPQLPMPTTTAEDIRGEYRDAYTREVSNDHACATDLGMAVHQYASATDPGVRCAVDLAGLSHAQMDWLLSLSDGDLQRLAQAGPKACQLAVSGKRCGVVGLPAPVRPPQSAVADKRSAVSEALLDRIRANASRPHLAA